VSARADRWYGSGGAAQPREGEMRIGRTRARSSPVARVHPIRVSLYPAASRPAPDALPTNPRNPR